MNDIHPGSGPDRGALVVIPARGGSAGIPLKNLQRVGGTTLVARAVRSALAAPSVTAVVVSTDHDEIAREATAHGAQVLRRPADIAGATASSESAVLHALDALRAEAGDPAVTVLLQATSPFVDPADLDVAVRRVGSGEHDVVVAVAPTHDFQWRLDDDVPTPVGHGTDHRPRRQDRAPHFRETGAFYAMRTAGLREAGSRFFGSVGLQPVAPEWSMEIDEPRDLWLARTLLGQPGTPPSDEPIDVDALVTDFDGVHTDDAAFVTQDGTESVRVHRGDGLGVARLRRTGVPLLILSTETNPVVAARARKLGVDVLHGVDDKAAALRDWCAVNRLDPGRVAYVGNDVNDLPALNLVGWPVAVADAHPEVAAAARVVLARAGGHGAVREVCERILAARPDAAARPAPQLHERKDTPVTSTASTTSATPRPEAPVVRVGDHEVGTGQPVYVIGEIGINHNGDVEIAKQLIDVAVAAGCQAVKFQKRTPEISTPKDQRDKIRQTPWGEMTYLEYKYRVEFEHDQYTEIDQYAKANGIQWFASPWDVPSVAFLEEFGVPTHKIASASVTDHDLLRALADTGKPLILSTGMSTLEQIDAAVEILGTDGLVMLHATSTYPLPAEEANLRTITTLQERYGVPVGYSGHETGLQISLAAVALGAVAVERHITLDRAMWGSDHAASLEPKGLSNLVRDIRILQDALGDGEKRVMPGELSPMSRLRRVDA
ncbi:3-deoxy-D-manno-octulosonate 8-phosphate phosphatase, YrbI family [Krasilnikoviella flava]|uniref:N-acylneuraminate cytidylyltransferase n=1 Tax=Krasilnikoviella flava TaxID=526729 RepID=A0A1T5IA01_9MICO|nr:3-deoxy-D-manno-octulosonate 8-phosphate phosphatase, YrbI family [Krasilnikoviella flava]